MQCLRPADAAAATGVMARAFAGYTYMRYITPEAERRDRMAAWFADASVRYGLRYGQVFASPARDGVAVWLPPGQTAMMPWRLWHAGFFAAPHAVGWRGIGRFIRTSLHMEHEHARFAPGPHWYLFALAVEPACQGRGIGGALLQPVLNLADADEVPCYLETHNARNANFYRRHGFEIMSQKTMPDGDMTIYAMRRMPHSHAIER